MCRSSGVRVCVVDDSTVLVVVCVYSRLGGVWVWVWESVGVYGCE